MENNIVEMKSKDATVRGLDLSKPHYRCSVCLISVQEIEAHTVCLCDGGPTWELSSLDPLPPALDITGNSPQGAPVLSWDERLELKKELETSRARRIEFLIDLHQRILYIESAVDKMAGAVGSCTPPPEILG